MRTLAAGVSISLLLAGGSSSIAKANVSCALTDARTGQCLISATGPATTGSGQTSGGAKPQASKGGTVSACTYLGDAVPCSTASGYWSNDLNCYVRPMSPPPPQTDPVWQGRTTGGIYECNGPAGVTWGYQFWSASAPAGPAAPPDPAQVAQTIVTQMNLRAFSIGMVPEEGPDIMGVVGVPAWMWVADPGEQTFGPMVRSASTGGTSVTATAKVDKIVWEMGDGGAVTCTTVGTVFTDGQGGQKSPDCGYTYSTQGVYTIRATSYWNVAWTSNSGATGNIPLSFTSSRTLTVGELQVVRTR